jgi:hypothetical protein
MGCSRLLDFRLGAIFPDETAGVSKKSDWPPIAAPSILSLFVNRILRWLRLKIHHYGHAQVVVN